MVRWTPAMVPLWVPMFCNCYFSFCCNKIFYKENLRNGRFTLALGYRIQSTTEKMSWWQEFEAVGTLHLQPGSRDRWMLESCPASPIFILRIPPM